ncbi:MAG TPA: hypothetical protein VND99_02915 [Candidatus Acidoferrales bacterium]|nr:hypothetical protein [Candidatus Acidoferrales bacterium]
MARKLIALIATEGKSKQQIVTEVLTTYQEYQDKQQSTQKKVKAKKQN